jgi:hypothetical protein
VILPEKIVTHRNIDIIFELANAKGKPLHDLEPLMGTDGHCVIIISSDAKSSFMYTWLKELIQSCAGPLVAFMTSFPKQVYTKYGDNSSTREIQ